MIDYSQLNETPTKKRVQTNETRKRIAESQRQRYKQLKNNQLLEQCLREDNQLEWSGRIREQLKTVSKGLDYHIKAVQHYTEQILKLQHLLMNPNAQQGTVTKDKIVEEITRQATRQIMTWLKAKQD